MTFLGYCEYLKIKKTMFSFDFLALREEEDQISGYG